MKSNSKKIIKVVYCISIFWLGFFISIFPLKTSNFSEINLTHEFSLLLSYGHYTYSYDDGYSYNSVQWSFSSKNGSKITVLAMDHSNFRKFDINDSSAKLYILSDGKRTNDNGIFNIPYDNYWFILFFNNDPDFSSSEVIISVEFIINPFLITILPIMVVSIVVSLYIIISIYFKKKKKENIATCFFFFFIIFLMMYLYISSSLNAFIELF
ncbi:MAG: hypothetical protein ACFFAK_05940 [Promethearchaeota archaeon]